MRGRVPPLSGFEKACAYTYTRPARKITRLEWIKHLSRKVVRHLWAPLMAPTLSVVARMVRQFGQRCYYLAYVKRHHETFLCSPGEVGGRSWQERLQM